MNFRIINFLIVLFSLCYFDSRSQENKEKERFHQHIETLEYMSRKTDNSKYYLDLALVYCDSLGAISKDDSWLTSQRKKIELTLGTCDQNMNHKVELFPFFNGFPSYMGFADDAIEYAYDDALNTLFETTYPSVQRGPFKDAGITSILTRGDCDEEMFEIIRQTIISNTNHYLIPYDELTELLGENGAASLTNGSNNDTLLSAVCEGLNLNKIGIFEADNIDNIDNKIFYVYTGFQTYSPESGFNESIFSKGFCEDKIGSGSSIPLLLLESILLIAFLAFIEELIYRRIKHQSMSVFDIWRLLKSKFTFTLSSLIIPSILSFVMVYSISFIMPAGPDHYMETSSLLWVILLTLGMSFVPILFNLFIINRIGIDGFHSLRGYRTFANATIYASYLPFFVFYLVYFEQYPRMPHLMMVVLSFAIGDILARSYYTFSSDQKYRNMKIHSAIGLLSGIFCLVLVNTFILTELSLKQLITCLSYILPIALLHYLLGQYLLRKNQNISSDNTDKSLLNKLPYLKSVIDPQKDFMAHIEKQMDKDQLFIGIIHAPMGIGKTRLLKYESSVYFENESWDYYYGDCDEIQDENTVSFEPFLEAFQLLLNRNRLASERSLKMENTIGSGFQNIIDELSPLGGLVGDSKDTRSRDMNDTAVEIVDLLEKENKKAVFVMEDLHWIDPESYAFLSCFIQAVNRSKFLRNNFCIVLSLRNNDAQKLRGLDHTQLLKDLNELSVSQPLGIRPDLLCSEDFKMKDFVKNLSAADNKFKLQEDSAFRINELINHEIDNISDQRGPEFKITPLYILKTFEKWIASGTLEFTPEGYFLSKQVYSEDLPNTEEVDSFYHEVIGKYEKQWQRLLESAAFIGNKFNADVLAQVWDHELLSVLTFLEQAEEDGLVTDLSEEDNIYKFNDKRIITAIKSFFKPTGDSEAKQVVVEYNKRYLNIQNDILMDPHNYSIEELLMVARRSITLLKHKAVRIKTERLFLDLIIRMIADQKYREIEAFNVLLNKKGGRRLANLFQSISVLSNKDSDYNQIKTYGINLLQFKPTTDFGKELRLIGLLHTKKRLEDDFDDHFQITPDELALLKTRTLDFHQGKSLIELSGLFLQTSPFSYSEKQEILNEIKINLNDNDDQTYALKHIQLRLMMEETNVDKDLLDSLSKECLDYAVETGNQSHLPKILELRLDILSTTKYLDNKRGVIDLYIKYEESLRSNGRGLDWVIFTLNFFGSTSAEYYIKERKEDAQMYILNIEQYIYSRYNETFYNDLIHDFVLVKIRFLYHTDQHDELNILCNNCIKRIKENLNQNHFNHVQVLQWKSSYFEKIGDYKLMIENRLKAIEILQSLHSTYPKKYRMQLKFSHNNIAVRFRLRLNDLESCLKHVELSNSYSMPEDGTSYGIGKYQLAKVHAALKDHKKAMLHYEEAQPYFSDDTASQLFKKKLFELNMHMSLCHVDIKEGEKKLKTTLKEMENPKIQVFISDDTRKQIQKAQNQLTPNK